MLAWMTWSKRQAMVRGPTPPVVGVMAVRSVRSRTELDKSPFRTPSSLAVPASTRTAPGLIIESEIKPGTPVALMIISNCVSFVTSEPRWKSSTL